MPHTVPACPPCGLGNICLGGGNLVCPDGASDAPKAHARATLLESAFLKKA